MSASLISTLSSLADAHAGMSDQHEAAEAFHYNLARLIRIRRDIADFHLDAERADDADRADIEDEIKLLKVQEAEALALGAAAMERVPVRWTAWF